MAKRSGADVILDKLTAPDFMFLHELEKLRFFQCAGTLNKHGMSAFRLGPKPMNLIEIAHFILAYKPTGEKFDEPSFETQINNLVSVGLLAKNADGTISCPILINSKTRADASRINGLKGGSPKKMQEKEAIAREQLPAGRRRQITRGAGNENPSANDTTYLLTTVTKEVEVSASETDDFVKIGQEAFDAAGLDPVRSMANFGIVKQWLADGADRDMIVDVVKRKTHSKVTTLNYFTAAIREEIAKKPKSKPAYEVAWERAYENWELIGRGFEPMPKLNDFKERFAA
jgi:hypothetical protein